MLRDEAKELIVRFISTYSYDGAVFFHGLKFWVPEAKLT